MLNKTQKISLLQTYTKTLYEFYHLAYHSVYKELFGWANEYSQNKRFEVLIAEAGKGLSFDPFDRNDILIDVGCGHAGLYAYILACKMQVQYIGLDFFAPCIEECKKRFPKQKFFEYDVMNTNDEGCMEGDIICMSGVLNLNIEQAYESIPEANIEVVLIVLERLMKSCRKGIVMNFLHEDAPSKDSFFAYHKPKHLMKVLKDNGYNIASWREGYLSNDFTLAITR